MRSNKKIGISDMNIYVPSAKLELDELIKQRSQSNPKLARHLDRALRVTGQQAIRFTEVWEDSATMAAQAAYGLLKGRDPVTLSNIRHLVVGTESGLDHSKPLSAFVQGMLQRAGLEIPQSLSSFQVQHACAGATLSLLSVGGLLGMSNRSAESGVVIATDVAHYETETTAEVTQGAGAVALLVETAPRLLELDLSTIGMCSRDVDDFFRPLGSPTAKVKGRYSMELYWANLEEAFMDHAQRIGELPSEVLEATDFFVLHTPFRNMPESAMNVLLQRHLNLKDDQIRDFLEKRGFYSGVNPLSRIGNIYSGSMYFFLASLLHDRFREMGDKIVGKRMLLASYGSGNTMIVCSGRVAEGAPEVIRSWDFDRIFRSAREAAFTEYQLWTQGAHHRSAYENLLKDVAVPPESFYLSGIREDGYREYAFAADVRDWISQREAPVDLRRRVPILR
ncbi:MAG: hydroxymethylglutaryl-CoA synthase [Spirochaetaceae bacterium]|nr:MAG: hydroxymethylglutaryl-CoA synthase [Spirochaetaceae bacterium]